MMKINPKSSISVIIPVYNEEAVIGECLASLAKQTIRPREIIVVDDGSKDSSKFKVSTFAKATVDKQTAKIILLEQKHSGPGVARNLGAKHASGDILLFVDADMTFAPNFLEKLVEPVINAETKGTFTKEEFVSNWDNVWARCWNFNQGIGTNRRLPLNYPNKAPVFRAILKSEFERVGGFDPIGFTDDWTLSRKLKLKASRAAGAICYHRNPSSLSEVWRQARWIGKNEFLTKKLIRRLLNLIRFSAAFSVIYGASGAFIFSEPRFFLFKLVYDSAVWLSVLLSFTRERKYK